MLKIYKIIWRLQDGVTLEKADLPEYYKVPVEQKAWSKKKIKKYLIAKYFYKIKKIEEL